ncbi:MAG TPA: hypothetical protein VKR43_16275 [Bryobacteraceae bacterium]|nr:hypothetical protein [Bryobacteraceae bacterium]
MRAVLIDHDQRYRPAHFVRQDLFLGPDHALHDLGGVIPPPVGMLAFVHGNAMLLA